MECRTRGILPPRLKEPSCITDMTKSRQLGFLHYQPSDQSFFDLFTIVQQEHVIPGAKERFATTGSGTANPVSWGESGISEEYRSSEGEGSNNPCVKLPKETTVKTGNLECGWSRAGRYRPPKLLVHNVLWVGHIRLNFLNWTRPTLGLSKLKSMDWPMP